MSENDNTPTQDNPTGATSPEEVVQDVRDQVDTSDAAPVQETTVEQTTTTTTEPVQDQSAGNQPANDGSTPNN
jgi:hypothetical protein